jgi:DNA-directed RNA polymerase specialized sigma24 family protein
VSPLTVRRYRAERMLRREFEGLRGRVMGTVRGRLRASGVSLDASDLEACYAQAWQGLSAAMLVGEEIANTTGWLALVTYRRAIEEHRSRRRVYPTEGLGEPDGYHGARGSGAGELAQEYDFAEELDDRIRLRQVFEGLRGRLGERELQAAALCYLQGLSRAEAAARMGISEQRMRKLMEGPGPGRPGVAGKVGELVETIRGGGWCEEQGSLMRGLAFGILDPAGERYRLAMAHKSECPACRAYILSLRGLAAVLPVPFLPGVLGTGALAGMAGAGTSTGVAASGGAGTGAGTGASVGAAGAGGAAGGSWFLAGGGIGAKLAVGCLVMAFSAGCVALTGAPVAPRHTVHRGHVEHGVGASMVSAPVAQKALSSSIADAQPVTVPSTEARGGSSNATRDDAAAFLPAAAKASREFGPEQALAKSTTVSSSSSSSSSSPPQSEPSARAASTRSGEFASTATPASGGASQAPSSSSQERSSSGGNAAQREFGIG